MRDGDAYEVEIVDCDSYSENAFHSSQRISMQRFHETVGPFCEALAVALHVPVSRVSAIVNERRGLTADRRCALQEKI